MCIYCVVSAGYSENLASAPEHASLIASKSAALQKVVETWYLSSTYTMRFLLIGKNSSIFIGNLGLFVDLFLPIDGKRIVRRLAW